MMLGSSYNLLGTIDAPTKSVNALAFSTNGRYLASGSDDMIVRVYDITNQFSVIWQHKGRSPFTAIVWREDSLITGTGDGEVSLFYPITFWSPSKLEKTLVAELYAPIGSLELNKAGTQLLVCAGVRASLLTQKKSGQWRVKCHLDQPGTFEEIEEFGRPDAYVEPPIVVTSAHFLQNDKECIVTYLHHGMWKCQLEAGTNSLIWGPDEKIGFTALSPDFTALAATNLRSGIDWFRLSSDKCRKMSSSLEVQDRVANIPIPILFIEKGKAALMGTTKGHAIILNVRTGRKITHLDHGSDKTWVTALAYVSPTEGAQILATGDRNRDVDTRIKVWIEDSDELESEVSTQTGGNLLSRHVPRFIGLARDVLALTGVIFVIAYYLPGHWKEATKKSIDFALSLSPFAILSGNGARSSVSESGSLFKTLGDLGKGFFQF